MTRIVIRHTVGSKANQVEEFPLDQVEDLVIGRDPQATVRFDPDKDDLVSRRHARITRETSDWLAFRIADLNSSNGLFINGVRVTGEIALSPGDEVYLGQNGPRFIFDVEPRPDYMVARTRILSALDSADAITIGPKATMLSSSALASGATTASKAPSSPQNGQRSSVGRATVERLIAYQNRLSRRVVYGTTAGVLGVALIGGSSLYAAQRSGQQQLASNVNEQLRTSGASLQAATAEIGSTRAGLLDKYGAKTSREIAEENADAVVMIRASWKLHDTTSGKQLFHKYIPVSTKKGQEFVPAYVQVGQIVTYWLTTDDEDGRNHPIGVGEASGSGFVVSNNGFIMTNKHVAADWLRPYTPPSDEGVVFLPVVDNKSLKRFLASPPIPESVGDRIKDWIPTQGIVFDRSMPRALSDGPVGREDVEVLFPRNKIGTQAHFVRASDRADVALIKVDMPKALNMVEMAPKEYALKLGEPISVLGYPAISPARRAVTKGQDLSGATHVSEIVPDPTLTNGIVAKLNSAEVNLVTPDSNVTLTQQLGDYFQLTDAATGAGNSGGPVFNSEGKVIGLFTADKIDRRGTRVTYAVPIKYGWDIYGLNPVVQK